MPVFSLTMPKLSPTMEAGTLVRWFKQEGDYVKSGDSLFEVTTDKATLEYESLEEGFLRQIVVGEGEHASVNEVIALMSEQEDESLEEFKEELRLERQARQAKDEVAVGGGVNEQQGEEGSIERLSEPTAASAATFQFRIEPPLHEYRFPFMRRGRARHQRVLATPLARQKAQAEHLDLSHVQGSGPGGRILLDDLKRAPALSPYLPSQGGTSKLPLPGSYQAAPLTPMRRAIGERLQAAKALIPHFYLQKECDASPLVKQRSELKWGQVHVTLNDLILRAVALTLAKHPTLNSGFDADRQQIIRFQTVDLAIAVSTEGGLITPLVRHADHKPLLALSCEIKELLTKAKGGLLSAEEYRGGSFTVSNLGMFGIDDFQAIINPPQVAILAVGAVRELPVSVEGQLQVGKRLTLSLSSDHRVVDGADAALFLKELCDLLEHPSLLLL